ncbi:MFS transporter [Novosphingobium sp. G106]|uniref:MFS transporter n=1 Tax=Novosphingobium sp. G106 TaxID=2849500 RepID=UPI0020C49732|nr:MFS transporter [Novosphingobium sp. G106]
MPASFAVGWRQVGICFLLLSATGMIASTYSIVAVPLAKEFQPSRMVLMLAMTVYSGASAVLMPLLGNLMDRVSVRRLMIAGGAPARRRLCGHLLRRHFHPGPGDLRPADRAGQRPDRAPGDHRAAFALVRRLARACDRHRHCRHRRRRILYSP